MFLIFLLLLTTGDSLAVHVNGQGQDGVCACPVNNSLWSFPVLRFEAALRQQQGCENSINNLQEQVKLSTEQLPQVHALIQNLTARLEAYQYVNDKGLYSALGLQQLSQELQKLKADVTSIHNEKPSKETLRLSQEVGKLEQDASRMHTAETINMKTVRERLRKLKNTAASCKSIPRDFSSPHCVKGLMTNISSPVVTKISPFGKSYTSGSWGHQTLQGSSMEPNSLWVQPLVNGHAWGNTIRIYSSHQDFMAAVKHVDVPFAPSVSHANSIEGPSMVLHGDALYYHCYRSADICRFNLMDRTLKRVTLPDFPKDKFLYCSIHACHSYSDVDLEADETGVWVIYATLANHGNLVLSRVEWDGEELHVNHTWETQLFKRAVTNAFMACGVMYATRYVDDFHEEVFYAFDTATGREDRTLSMPLEKIAKGVASVSYSPVDKRIYMYNEAYLLSYQSSFMPNM